MVEPESVSDLVHCHLVVGKTTLGQQTVDYKP